MSLPTGSDNLDFLDGYLFRVMVDILKTEGAEAGLYNYYEGRIAEGRALSPYDRMIFEFARSHFGKQNRRIVHAGIGIGTLTSTLAVAGYRVAGIERDGKRFRAASRVRDALIQAWPTVMDRYELLDGLFPDIVNETAWMGPDTALIFTNCGAGWNEELTARIIRSFIGCGDVILDARLFGIVRDTPAHRQELLDQIDNVGLKASRIGETLPGFFFYHVHSRSEAQ